MKLINKSQSRIIMEIYRNPGINLREVILKTRLSPNYVSEYINFLVKRKILIEERLEKKRVYLRRFFLDFKNHLTKNLLSIVKSEEREVFFEKYPKLRPVFEQLSELTGIEFVLVYGSYARFSARKDSDIDILVVGKVDKSRIREIFVSLNVEPSIKIESEKDFIKRKDDALHQQILKEGILIYDSGRFLGKMKKIY